jgi:hypothetical protein
MNITRENCEAWFLDYYEGRLEPHQAELLFAFLDENPDLHEVFNSFEAITLDDLSVSYGNKDELKRVDDLPRTINEINCEEIFIADAEGLLDAEMKKQLAAFLQQFPAQRATYELYQQTRLQPEAIVFDEKALLKKAPSVITAENEEEWFIASAEKRLNSAEKGQLEKYIAAHPEKKQALALFAATVLTPDMSVVYPDKMGLKRKQGAAVFTAWRAAAAILLLFAGSYGIIRFTITNEITGSTLSLASAHSGRTAKTKNVIPENTTLPEQHTGNTYVAAVNNNVPATAKEDWITAGTRPLQQLPRSAFGAASAMLPVDAEEGSAATAIAAVNRKPDENEFPSIAKIASTWVVDRFELELPAEEQPVTGVSALQHGEPDGWDWTSAIVKKVSKGHVLIKTRKNEDGKRRFDIMAWKYRFSNEKNI